MRFLDSTNDLVFKKIFGNKDKQNILIKWGQNDKTPGIATLELNKLLNSWF